jgi:hypothetical protein
LLVKEHLGVPKIWEQRTGPEHRAAHEAYPPPAQTPQVSQAIIQNVNSVLAGLASAIQGAVERVRLDRRRRVAFRPEPGPGRSMR